VANHRFHTQGRNWENSRDCFRTAMVEDVLRARVYATAIALLDAVTVDSVRCTAAWVLWCLLLVVVEAAAARCCAVVIPVTPVCKNVHGDKPLGQAGGKTRGRSTSLDSPHLRRDVKAFVLGLAQPAGPRVVSEALELDEPRGVGGVI
jgi:hypothetical protein